MKIRLASDLQRDSVVDGEGIRTVIWTQGCSHNCAGCHNQSTHSFKGGFEVEVKDILNELDTLVNSQNGITLSGGDPFFQIEACVEIAKKARQLGLNVWAYTGFTYDQILSNPKQGELLKYVDILVDGKFLIDEFSLDLKFKGSRNQRIIDVQQSLVNSEICIIEKYNPEPIKIGISYEKEEFIFI